MVALLLSPHEVGGRGFASANPQGGLVRRELTTHHRNPPRAAPSATGHPRAPGNTPHLRDSGSQAAPSAIEHQLGRVSPTA